MMASLSTAVQNSYQFWSLCDLYSIVEVTAAAGAKQDKKNLFRKEKKDLHLESHLQNMI